MSSFLSPLVVTPMPDGRKWRLVRSFTYHVGSLQSKTKVIVKAGFITDFASVPSQMWWLLPPWGKYGKAAIIHDYLYQNHLFTRGIADHIFFEAMGVLKVPTWKRLLMFWAVRIFGRVTWG